MDDTHPYVADESAPVDRRRRIGILLFDGVGELALKSVRNIQWDLQMTEFNGVAPLPRDIRAMLETK